MDLHRVTQDAFENYRYYPNGKYIGHRSEDSALGGTDERGLPRVVTRFPRFGAGTQRLSDFEVYVEWQDMERMLDVFCDSNHPDALRLREARRAAEALTAIGWKEPSPHSP
jgi:hypothetical protein